MIRKIYILSLMLVLGFIPCSINGFADAGGGFADKLNDVNAEGGADREASNDFQGQPDLIVGTPDFEKIRDLPRNSQDYILGRTVAAISDNVDLASWCTGFLVGPDLLLTNHHCIYDKTGNLIQPLNNLNIHMDYYDNSELGDYYGKSDSGFKSGREFRLRPPETQQPDR